MSELTPYAQSLVDYVRAHTGMTELQAIEWLNEYLAPNWQQQTDTYQ